MGDVLHGGGGADVGFLPPGGQDGHVRADPRGCTGGSWAGRATGQPAAERVVGGERLDGGADEGEATGDGGEEGEGGGGLEGGGVLNLWDGSEDGSAGCSTDGEVDSESVDDDKGSVGDSEEENLLDVSPVPAADRAFKNQVVLPVDQFRAVIHDLAFFSVSVYHHLSREALGDLLRLESHQLQYRSPYRQQRLVSAAVDLHEVLVDTCPSGCIAFTAARSTLTACDICQQSRYKADLTTPRRQVTYWLLIPWLTAMLEDPVLGVDMTAGMAHARARASQPISSYEDWYDGSNFRNAVQRGCFRADTDVALSLSTDGFEVWRQQGFQGWPIVVSILNLDANCRTRVVNQLLVGVTPGPKQPADLESFLHPLAEELNTLAIGVPGIKVAGRPGEHTLRGYLLHVSSDMPGGDKIMNATGHNGHQPNRFRAFSGVYYRSHTYYPPVDPRSGAILFAVDSCPAPRRTAASIAEQVERVESARREGRPQARVTELRKLSGFKGYSLFCSPSAEHRLKYPGLSYLWACGPSVMPYDCMHLLLLNVTPLLWLIFSGQMGAEGDGSSDMAMAPAVVAEVGRELRNARATVPCSQARSLRNLAVSFRSYKAVDWLVFLLSTAEVVLAGRLSQPLYNMVMHLVKACRLLFRPRPLSLEELSAVDEGLKRFCQEYYALVYRGEEARLPFCRSTIAALLDIAPNIRSCGPIWTYWQFGMERLIGTLPRLVGSRSSPYPSLVKSISRKYQAELITAFGERFLPDAWSAANGKLSSSKKSAEQTYPMVGGSDFVLLPPRQKAVLLVGPELAAMHAVLAVEGVEPVPGHVRGMKYGRVRLANGVVVGSKAAPSDDDSMRRRSNFVRVRSTDRVETSSGGVQEVSVQTYGLVLHYVAVFAGGAPRAFAYIECICSGRDRLGKYGLPELRFGLPCFGSFGGRRRYVSVGAIDAVVGTLFTRGKHHILFPREPFSSF